ncbi:C2H2 zinc finger protein [Musa troglodytarum]|uniref:C2H2 zinc finger protein n=1 Tax=Musa troglodytarum TaxID=320322 RepID=A0A9E7EUB1_9LILI|nr:C2H2 zinc finger protein [Musa troglodytarum]
MADGRNKDSKPSSDEAGSAEPRVDDSGGTRRPYYECTFCKRGFSNAQALGGHMNLHRKRRTRERQSPATPSVMERPEDDYASNNSAYCPDPYEPFRGYTYFPSSSLSYNGSDARMGTDSGLQAPYEMSLFGGELLLGSSTHAGEGRRQEVEDAELDLELRLGHRP